MKDNDTIIYNVEEERPGRQLAERHLVLQDSGEELLPEINEQGDVLRAITRAEAQDGRQMLLHPVVHLHVYNRRGELYLQRRAAWKTVQPDKWDTAMGGHVDYGETVRETLAREVFEEIGMRPEDYEPKFIKKYVYQNELYREMVYVFSTVYDGPLSPSETETSGGRFWTLDEIMQNIGKGVFTPMFDQEFPTLPLP